MQIASDPEMTYVTNVEESSCQVERHCCKKERQSDAFARTLIPIHCDLTADKPSHQRKHRSIHTGTIGAVVGDVEIGTFCKIRAGKGKERQLVLISHILHSFCGHLQSSRTYEADVDPSQHWSAQGSVVEDMDQGTPHEYNDANIVKVSARKDGRISAVVPEQVGAKSDQLYSGSYSNSLRTNMAE